MKSHPDKTQRITFSNWQSQNADLAKLLWGNAILYNYRVPLSAGHSDDAALLRDPDFGWGWFVDEGFDIIQTDWTLAMDLYLKNCGKRTKKLQ